MERHEVLGVFKTFLFGLGLTGIVIVALALIAVDALAATLLGSSWSIPQQLMIPFSLLFLTVFVLFYPFRLRVELPVIFKTVRKFANS